MDYDAKTLRPAEREDVLRAMEHGMKFRRGKATSAARDAAVSALAAMVLEHLEMCGYVFMRQPPARPPSTP
jgi:hypothetical protein